MHKKSVVKLISIDNIQAMLHRFFYKPCLSIKFFFIEFFWGDIKKWK